MSSLLYAIIGYSPGPLSLVTLFAFDTIDHTTCINCLASWFGVCGTGSKRISRTIVRPSKLAPHCQSFMNYCMEYHKALSLAHFYFVYTPLHLVKLSKGTPALNFIAMLMILSYLSTYVQKMLRLCCRN